MDQQEPVAQSRRVLVVDDNADATEMLAMLLRHAGHDVRVLTDARQARDAAAGFVPQVVLLDLGMPHVSGFDVARSLRELPELRHVMLVALSGHGRGDYVRRAREAGFTHYYVKPLDPERLQALLINPPPSNL